MTHDIIKLDSKYYPAKFTLEILPVNLYLSRDGMFLSPEEVSIFGPANEDSVIKRVPGRCELRMEGEFSGLDDLDLLNDGFYYLGRAFIFESYSLDGSFVALAQYDSV